MCEEKQILIYTINGSSMYPQYKDGDIVTGTKFDGRLRKGFCYGYIHNGNKVFHRYIGTHGKKLIFSGDNCSLFEEVTPENIFFSGHDPGLLWYNYSILVSNLFFLIIFRINPIKNLKTLAARLLYYLLKRELPHGRKRTVQ